ncbi:hypothetical protein F5Y06DRAFT_302371 [Hypoxylon sp. FL0890]|nr:hypothetical protein F5Y06DRAFT_302371 [Hypoxylon sp. FL0890]
MSSANLGAENFYSLPPDQQARILDGPAMQPPAGVVPNFDNPPNSSVAAQAVLGLCLALITISLCGRLCIRFFFKQLFIGDYLLILAYAFNAVYLALAYRVTISPGAFVHLWDVRVAEITPILYNGLIMSHMYLFSIAFIKIAILLEWIRIFVPRGTRNLIFWASHLLIWINVATCIVNVIIYNIACTPHEYLWNKLIDGTCSRIDTGKDSISMSACNLITDVLIFLIPQKAIWNLQMSTKKKAGVSLTFAVGIIGIATATLRLVETISRIRSPDYMYDESLVMLCSVAETTCAFLVVCIPALPKAFTSKTMSKVKSSLESRSSSEKLRKLRNWNIKNIWRRSIHNQLRLGQDAVEIEEHRLYPVGRSQPAVSTDQSSSEHLESGILRTPKFEAKVGYDPTTTSAEYSRKHVLNGIV